MRDGGEGGGGGHIRVILLKKGPKRVPLSRSKHMLNQNIKLYTAIFLM